jgi:exonuclease VII large subunit
MPTPEENAQMLVERIRELQEMLKTSDARYRATMQKELKISEEKIKVLEQKIKNLEKALDNSRQV